MIVVDTSVAMKWVVKEPDHEAALDVVDLRARLIAPDLLLPELIHALGKKCDRGEIVQEQSILALSAMKQFVVAFVPSIQLAEDAFRIARELRHPTYDCFFLALALTSGVLVTADRAFSIRCREAGYGRYVHVLGEPLDQIEIRLALASVPDHLVAEIMRLLSLIDATKRVLEQQEQFGSLRITRTTSDFETYSLSYQDLRHLLGGLDSTSLRAYTALCWLGRTYYSIRHWPQLWRQAEGFVSEGFSRHEAYLLAQATSLQAGFETLEQSRTNGLDPE